MDVFQALSIEFRRSRMIEALHHLRTELERQAREIARYDAVQRLSSLPEIGIESEVMVLLARVDQSLAELRDEASESTKPQG